MRRVRDFDSELKELEQRTRTLKERNSRQLGELVTATGGHALDLPMLAGGLLAMVEASDPAVKEGWRAKGDAFFHARSWQSRRGANGERGGAAASDDRAASG